MTFEEFQVLYRYHKRTPWLDKALEENAELALDGIKKIQDTLMKKEWIKDGEITSKGYTAMEPYKVDNAVILAAGFGLRSLPLSRVVPKGLYKVKGEVLIERQIQQILDAGIRDIIIVVGYLKEKFEYLKDKYNVKLIENADYYRYNNISSLYIAKDLIGNSYICCSDNYFSKNVFRDYVYDSYYSCLYTDIYAEEYCVVKMDGPFFKKIVKGGKNAWYTIGEAFFSKSFSKLFFEYLDEEYEQPEVKNMLWDDFHIRHIDKLKLRLVKYDTQTVQEFDTNEDILAFDPEFAVYRDEMLLKFDNEKIDISKIFSKYEDMERYNSATTDQHYGRLHLNENLFGPSPKCMDVLKNITREEIYEYDMASKDFLIEKISQSFSMPEDDIYIHNGSAEMIKSVFSIALERGDNVLLPNPGWNYYESLAKEKFCNVVYYSVRADDYTYYNDVKDLLDVAEKTGAKLILINSPHNPTGCKIDGNSLETIIKFNPDTLILLDQAYWGFYEEDIDIRKMVESYTNVIVTRTFSKYYALADMRIGYGFCNSKVKHIFGLDLPLFRENTISRKMAAAALDDKDYYIRIAKELNEIKKWFTDMLNQINGVRAFYTSSNFVAVKFGNENAYRVRDALKEKGILVRMFRDGDDILLRISIGDREIMKKALSIIYICFCYGDDKEKVC